MSQTDWRPPPWYVAPLPLCPDPSGMCGRHPGRVERVGRMSGRGSPALAGSLPSPSPPGRGEEGKRTRRAERQARASGRDQDEERARKTEGSGRQRDASKRRQDGRQFEALPLCWLLSGRWRGVAMTSPRSGRGGRPSASGCDWVRTVRQAGGTEERRGTGEDGGGILCPVPLSSPVFRFLFFFLSFAFVLSIYIIRYI